MSPLRPSSLTRLFKTGAPKEVARAPGRAVTALDWAARSRALRPPRPPAWMRKNASLLFIVVLPTLLTAIYYFLIASNQYASEAHFLIHGQQSSNAALFGQFMSTMSTTTSQEDLLSVDDYMESHDALAALQKQIDIAALFRRPEADWFARMGDHISAEGFLDYYDGKVVVSFDTSSGLATLRVRAFRPQDAQLIASTLLNLGEERVNEYSERQREDTLKIAHDEVSRAEARVTAAREELTAFRDREKSIDPGKSSIIVMEVIGKLEGQLAQTRADMTEASTYLKADNAKFVGLRAKAEALEHQIVSEKQRLTGSDDSLAPVVAGYERLVLEREFADKGLASAMASLETARNEAAKQHFYLVRVVEPNLPEKALYPKRMLTVVTVFVALCFTYGIGWLIIAGIREHAA